MLHELLSSNRDQLISRCKAKVAKRFAPAEIPAGVDNGVPLFLGQLAETLRCLDNAIADAVTAFAGGGRDSINDQAEALSERLGLFSYDHVRLLDMAIQSFNAIQTGNIGATGATGIAHKNSLLALRALVQQSMAQIRLASAKTTLPPHPKPATVK